jgi:hypothetical protein
MVRNAHLAGYEAEICAHNILNYLKYRSSDSNEYNKLSTANMLRYPEDAFGSGLPECPLNVCVSLGKNNNMN